MLRNLVELVIFSPKAKEKNPWSNLGQNDHLYSIVADFESLLPFPVFHFFGFRCAGSCKFLHAFVPPGRVRRINSLGRISQLSAGNRTISCSWRLYGNCFPRVFGDFVWVGYWCESRAVPAGYPMAALGGSPLTSLSSVGHNPLGFAITSRNFQVHELPPEPPCIVSAVR